MSDSDRTIAARLTAPGVAGLAVLGLHGPAARSTAQRLFRDGACDLSQRLDQPVYGFFGNTLRDDVVLTARSDQAGGVVEISCHGGEAMVRSLLADLKAEGIEVVDWREFQRATGRSEIEIEAMDVLSRCSTAKTAAILLDQMQGRLDEAFDRVLKARDRDLAQRLLERAAVGLHLASPWKVLLFGKANVGKSSLLNALAGYERAIVAPIAGTTRDLLSVSVSLDGWPIELFDGAGFHAESLELESQGQQRIREQVSHMDLRIQVLDLSTRPEPLDDALAAEFRPDLLVGAKSDLSSPWSEFERGRLAVCCSATTNTGILELAKRIVERLAPTDAAAGGPTPFTARQVAVLKDFLNRS